MVTIKEVRESSARQKREFTGFAKWLYRDEPHWITPLDSSIERVFDTSANPLFANGEACRWLAYSDMGECVGRIAAFYTLAARGESGLHVGGCGFFESIDSTEVSAALFDTARDWLIERGFEGMDGSINFGARDSWWGVLTRGFEHEPLFENNYNLPYYAHLFEEYGFRCYFKQYTYRWRIGVESVNERIDRRSERLGSRGEYTARSIKRGEMSSAVEWFVKIYNRAWSNFPDTKAITAEECRKIFHSMEAIVDYNLLMFAFYRGEPIGFIIMIPDINRIIRGFDGGLTIWHKLLLWWRLKITKQCDRAFGMVFGVEPQHQGRGVESLIITTLRDEYILKVSEHHYKTLEFAWIGDFNPTMNRMIEAYVGAERHKEHTTYRVLFDKNIPFERHPTLNYR